MPESALNRIYGDNFIQWAGEKPKPVRFSKAGQMVKKYREFAAAREDGQDLLPDFDEVLRQMEKRRSLWESN